MPIYIKKSARLTNLLKGTPFISDIRKEFNKRGPNEFRKTMLEQIAKSISPVKGEGKFVRYSESYIEQIRGSLGEIWAKQITPVNLKLSGTLLNSLKVYGVGLLSKTYVLRIQFTNFLADIHNRRGASKNKVIRRLLPTNNGEEFNYTISRQLLKSLREAVEKIVAKYNA